MLVREQIEIKLVNANISHYTNKGYTGNTGDMLLVWSTDLPETSRIKVLRVCDECGAEQRMKRVQYRPVCKKCVTINGNKNRKDESKTTCKCGKPKSYQAKKCKSCWNIEDNTGENSSTYGVKNPALAERNKNRKPEDHWNYKGGVSKRSGKQVAWATTVKDVAGYICDCCGYARRIALVAHHLHSDNTDKGSFEVSNGVCLCQNCHTEFHKINGYGDNTPEQYIKFKEDY